MSIDFEEMLESSIELPEGNEICLLADGTVALLVPSKGLIISITEDIDSLIEALNHFKEEHETIFQSTIH